MQVTKVLLCRRWAPGAIPQADWSVFIRQRTATAACTAVAVLVVYPAI